MELKGSCVFKIRDKREFRLIFSKGCICNVTIIKTYNNHKVEISGNSWVTTMPVVNGHT